MKKLSILTIAIGLFFAACQSPTAPEKLLNADASLPARHTISDKGLKVITSLINKKEHTMATLYGNPAALQSLQSGSKPAAGEELTLITWKQKNDEHWFGAKIPGAIQSLETVKIIPGEKSNAVTYQSFAGPALTANKDTTGQAGRIAFILSQQPSVMP
jgi:hypothetical protein